MGAGGIVTAMLVLRYFTPDVQGYYYTFANILALQIFLELGLSAVVTMFAAHEWSKLSLAADQSIEGDAAAKSRLGSLARLVALWYFVGAVLLLALLVPAGYWFFHSQAGAPEVEWQEPWLFLCLLATVNFSLTPAWAMLSGCGRIAHVNAYKAGESIVRYAALWTCMVLGAALWSAVAAITATTIAACAFLFVSYRRFLGTLLRKQTGPSIEWRGEILPLQARIALSWVSGYFVYSLFTPATFYFLGPSEAGRIGLTWAVLNGLSGIAATWLQAQTPALSMMVARKEFAELDRTVARTAAIGVAVFLVGGFAALIALRAIESWRPDLTSRFIPLGAVAVFLFAELLHQLSMAQSTFLRVFKREPFLGLSILTAVTIGGGTLWLTPNLGAYGPALSYIAGMCLALAWGSLIFIRKRKEWTS